MSDFPETVMLDRCKGCAFRPGTEASESPWTRSLAHLCVQAGTMFECHDAGAGHACKGWLDAFTTKLKAGEYDRQPEWKRKIFLGLIDVLQQYREADEHGESASFDGMAAIHEAVDAVLAKERAVELAVATAGGNR